jgi:hypothetical protein
MPTGQGVTSKAAFKVEKTTAWGTSTDLGAGDQIHFISESVSHAIEQAQSIYKDGSVSAKSLYPIFKKYGGDILIEAHYAGMESMIAVAMGMSHQTFSPRSATTTTYEHFIELSEDMSTRVFSGYEMTSPSGNASRRGTLGFEKTVSLWELASAMYNTMNFEAAPERVTFSFTVAGKTLEFDTATNPNSSSWTLPTNTEQIVWDDMTVYLKPRDLFTITSTNDNQAFNDGVNGIQQIDVDDGTYTGLELAQAIAAAATAHALIDGEYRGEYDEILRRFRFYTVDGQTFVFVPASADGSDTIGMTQTQVAAEEQESDHLPIIDTYTVFDSGDAVGVSKITFALENALDIESQDSESDLNILEPERNGFRRVTGTIEIPRYKNDTFLKATNGFTTYMMWINFTGSAIDSENYEMNLYFPSIKFSNTEASITGAELIKQTLAFEAEYPKIVDLTNFGFEDFKELESDTITESTLSVGVGPEGIYVGCTAGAIYTWEPFNGSFSLSTDLGAQSWGSLHSFQDKMFAGGQAGEVYYHQDNVWTSSTDVGSGIMVAFEEYGGELFVLERNTGEVFYYPDDDTSWSSSTDTTATDANAIIRYGSSLFMIGSDGATFTRAYEYSGGGHLTGWSTNCDFGSSSTVQAACIHESKLYVTAGAQLLMYDGSTWTSVDANVGISPIWIGSWRGNLMMLVSGATADLYVYDFDSGTAVNIYPSLALSQSVPANAIVGDTIFLPQSDTTFHMVQALKELAISIKNQNATNPL